MGISDLRGLGFLPGLIRFWVFPRWKGVGVVIRGRGFLARRGRVLPWLELSGSGLGPVDAGGVLYFGRGVVR